MADLRIKAVVFDIDGTLTENVSWQKMTECMGADVDELNRLYDGLKNGSISYLEAKTRLVALWQATGKANREALTDIFLSWPLRDDALPIISYLKSKYRVVLISGSVDLYVETVAHHLGIDVWYANTKLVWDEQGNLTDLDYDVRQAQKKLSQFKEYLSKNGLKRSDCMAVGDGDSDLELFHEIPLCVAVKNKSYPLLEKIAWKSISKLSEIKILA